MGFELWGQEGKVNDVWRIVWPKLYGVFGVIGIVLSLRTTSTIF